MADRVNDVCALCGLHDHVTGLRVCRWEEPISAVENNRKVARLCGTCATARFADPVCVFEAVSHEDVPPWE